MHEFRMPSLGADMRAGTLVERLKAPGEAISRGDIIAVVETEKGAIEVEVFVTGTLAQWLVPEGATVPVGTPLALIATAEEGKMPLARPGTAPPSAGVAPSPPPAAMETRIKASPAARAYAQEHRIDLATVPPGTPGGPILRADVERRAATRPTPEPAQRKRPGLDLDKMRNAIAAAMAHSKREIPHYYLGTMINLRRATGWLSETNRSRPPEGRLLMNVLLLKAVGRALRQYPRFNGFYADGAFTPADSIHIGMAIAIRGGGLVAPAIHDCDTRSLDDLMSALRDLIGRVRQGSIRSSEMSDPTITLTSLGERGADTIFGIIYPPQVAIIGFGAPHLAAVAHPDGGLAADPVVAASLAADHRVTDGRLGASFLAAIDDLLQEPEKL